MNESEILREALKFYAAEEHWHSTSRHNCTRVLLDPEHVSGKLTGQNFSGLSDGGWEVAQHALARVGEAKV